ncbi:P-loop NTPase fold protein [Gordonia sp. LSe1-13]|uniref:P-loop NTPase fold protein n=1 Tax=Gordonia sesuvii TaxID=3116777 RepID=A0ABU7M7E1_9ACTN|nr:P-loop NTPase fold protein [Gordonia sp. LSe1-13]
MTTLLSVSVFLGGSAFEDAARDLIPQAGTVFGLSLVAVIVGPQVLQGAVVTTKRPPPVGADQFATRFNGLVDKVTAGRRGRLVVFIDELDRCSPDDVVSTLVDLKTFLDQKDCTFIVAADREVIEQSLSKVPQAKPIREGEPYYATPGAFLDKIFQHQIAMPPLRTRALTEFAHKLVREQGGLWQQLRERGSDDFERTIFALVPVHVRSPRRVKVLLNNFATNARVAEARRIAWLERAHEIAILTVLQTEFPSVADELRRVPRLLMYLRGEETSQAGEVKAMVERFADRAPDAGAEENAEHSAEFETPAGRLLSEPTEPDRGKRRDADRTIRHHLGMYLSKVRAAGMTDPRPDLLYLQSAGAGDSLGDPQLGDVIDFATDTAPSAVLEAFAGKDSRTLAVAISLLATEGDNGYGPGRQFAYESACRLSELIDDGDDRSRETVVRGASASLIAAVSAGGLSSSSLPGALLVGCWAGRTDIVTSTLGSLKADELEDDLLNRLCIVFPHLDEGGAKAMSGLLAGSFGQRPTPFTEAVASLPTTSALMLWKNAESSVLETLSELEKPSPAEADARSSISGSARAATPSDRTEPVPSGEGVDLLETLVNAVRSRPGDERLLSAVLASAQSWRSCDPLRSWILNNADSLIATMASPLRRSQHALLGLLYSPEHDWVSWAEFLPTETESSVNDAVPSLAGQVLTDRLLPAITSADELVRAALSSAVARVHALAEVDGPALVTAISTAAEEVEWVDAEPARPASEVWSRKKTMVEVAAALAVRGENDVLSPVVNDLAQAIETCTLSDVFVAKWLELTKILPGSALNSLSDRIDQYEYAGDEEASGVRLKLGLRTRFGGVALPGSELSSLVDIDTPTTGAWLALRPPPEDVRLLLDTAPFAPADFGTYCATLPLEERTKVWLAVEERPALSPLLRSAGQGGIGPEAVQKIRAEVADTTRQADRAAAIERLLRAEVPSETTEIRNVRRAASEFALELLTRGTTGDLRTAADLVLWAGGPGHGYTAALRKGFAEAPDRRMERLTRSHVTQLEALGLISPSKGFVDRLLRRS